MNTHERPQDQPTGALRPEHAAHYLGIGRTAFYELLNSGEIPSGTIGKSRLIRRVDLDDYLARLVGADQSQRPGAA